MDRKQGAIEAFFYTFKKIKKKFIFLNFAILTLFKGFTNLVLNFINIIYNEVNYIKILK